jgi:hypothetical protein
MGLARTIVLIDLSTSPHRGQVCEVFRGSRPHGHARQPRLVRDKGSQLMERPTVLDAPLRLFNRDRIANPLEILQSSGAMSALGFRDQRFGDAMVDISREPVFRSTSLLEEPLRRLGALLLRAGLDTL